ncbi:MAG: hypothetical protein ACOYEW_07965 [Anaerolineae bacterium]|jgi:hypothetical protein
MKTRSWLVVVAVAGLALAVAALALFTVERRQTLRDLTETRAAIEASLARLLPSSVPSAQDEALLRAAEQVAADPSVAGAWVIDQEGTIVFHRGIGPGEEGQSIHDLDQGIGRRLLEALPADSLRPEVQLQVLGVAALGSEGATSAALEPLLRSLRDDSGRQVGLLVLVYGVAGPAGSSSIRALVPAAVGGGLALYWLTLPLWVFLDARPRGENALLWAAFVLVTNLVGLIAYLLVLSRPRTT